MLTACSTDSKPPTKDVQTDDVSVEKNQKQTDGESEEGKDDSVIRESEELAGFPEYDILSQKVSVDKLKGVVQADNKGKRVILFENSAGEKEYKSIFVKHDKRLKIIKLHGNEDNEDEGLIYNETIN